MAETHSTKSYFVIYFILIGLTLLTCALSLLPEFEAHTTVGLAVAAIKATLIAMFFMHLLRESQLPFLALAISLLWTAILIGFMLADYLTRGSLAY
jgi:cytochrome c oxidase subunit IV